MPALAVAPELVFIALVIVTIALAWFAAKLIVALLQPLQAVVSHIPGVGGALNSAIQTAIQAVVNAMGKVEAGCDKLVGWSFHLMARMLDKTWQVIEGEAAALANSARVVGSVLLHIHAIRALANRVTALVHAIEHPLRTLERQVHGIEHGLKALEKDFSHGIGEDVLPRLHTLDRELTKLRHKTIPALRDAANTAENDAEIALGKVEAIPFPTGVKTWAEAIAVALGTLGLGGLRCNSLLSSLKGRGCGLWSGLDDLLGLFVDAFLLTAWCDILPEAVRFFGLVEGALTGFISEAANALCSLPNKGWATLNVSPGPQPPAQSFAATSLPPNV